MATGNEAPAIRAAGIGKSFPGVTALADVDFAVRSGEVRALVGKNGAGKSTLVKILSGIYQPDHGLVEVGGTQVVFKHPKDAQAVGISIVHQELSLVPGLSVAENVFLGRWPTHSRGPLHTIAAGELRQRAASVFETLGVSVDVGATVGTLSPALRQLTEIAKAVAFEPRILILDEPTSSLVSDEVELVLQAVRNLSDRGAGVVYVSHRMDEIPRVATSITVLRDGQHVATGPIEEFSVREVANLIVGESGIAVANGSGDATISPVRREQGEPLMEARGLRTRVLNDVDISLHAGEVVGLIGLLGSGRTEVLRALAGADKFDAGTISVRGRPVSRPTPRRLRSLGVGLVPEDRKGQGLVLGLAVEENLTMAAPQRITSRGWISGSKVAKLADATIDELSINTRSRKVEANLLSGGNQQKVVFGKWLIGEADVLLLDEPTRGVDIEAKAQMYELIRGLRDAGKAILFVSSETEEVFEVCSRVLVLQAGAITGEYPIDQLDVASALSLSMGTDTTDGHPAPPAS